MLKHFNCPILIPPNSKPFTGQHERLHGLKGEEGSAQTGGQDHPQGHAHCGEDRQGSIIETNRNARMKINQVLLGPSFCTYDT